MARLYKNLGEAVNEIANVDDIKQVLGVMLKGDALPMPYISDLIDGVPVRTNRKYTGNLDDLLLAGSYLVGTSATGTPADGNLGWLDVYVFIEGDGTVRAMQRYLTYDMSSYHHRRYDGSSWGAWS
jgi:hypothetical protein